MPFLGKTPTKLLDANVNIDGGNIDGTTIGASSTAPATVSTFTSTGIDDNATSTAITIDSDGDVGIGLASPLFQATNRTAVTINGTTSSNLTFGVGGSANTYFLADSAGFTIGNTSATLPTMFYTNSAERMRIASNGRVGIGETSPNSLVHLKTSGTTDLTLESTGASGREWLLGSRADGALNFYDVTGSSEAMRIDASGNLGIGTTSPSAKLHAAGNIHVGVEDNSNHSSRLKVINGGSAGYEASLDFCYEDKDTVRARINTDGSGGRIEFHTFDGSLAERMRIDSSGRLLINITDATTGSLNPTVNFKQLSNASYHRGMIIESTDSDAFIGIGYSGSAFEIGASYRASAGYKPIAVVTGGYERMRIDTSGNVLVGTTSASGFLNSTSETGVINYQSGALGVSKSSDIAGYFKRLGNDGVIVEFRNSTAATVGAINTRASQLAIGCTGTGLEFNDANDAIIPFSPNANNTRDNALDLGTSSVRFDDIYATNNTINTSDANEKQDIEALSEAETRVAVACKGLLRKFRWKSAVEEKGDDARIHFGIIAQDLQAAFEAEGLDAGRYGMFIHSTWTDEETGEERSRMGVRYSELLAFIIAAI